MITSDTGLRSVASVRKFAAKGTAEECHVIIHCGEHEDDTALEEKWLAALDDAEIPAQSTILRRLFCRNVTQPKQWLADFQKAYPGAFSVIGQPPLNGTRLAMWSYHILDPARPPAGSGGGPGYVLERGPLRHAWNAGLCDVNHANPGAQASAIMHRLMRWLDELGLTLRNDVIRTWWFVRDIDRDYQALVDARNTVFEENGLTKDTHFIASTGIAGGHPTPSAKMSLDTYAIGGLFPGQIEFIQAPERLGPTHRYGVTFERATSVSYADRRHVFISGTASIDPEGRIVHPGDVVMQLERTLGNISALLASANAAMSDLAHMIVYLRNPEDGPLVEELLQREYHNIPMVLVHAPVCRPGWLIEIEGMACVAADNPGFPAF